MKLSIDRLLRGVWLSIGVLLLVGFLGVGAILLFEWVGYVAGGGEDAVEVAGESPAPAARNARIVRFDPPARVRGTDVRLVLVRNGTGYEETSSDAYSVSSRRGGRGEGPVVNVAFLPGGGGPGRLLFDRPVYVEEVDFPSDEVRVSPGSVQAGRDSLTTWITYEAAVEDTNDDRRLDWRDRRGLFISALDGTGFRRVLPEGFRLRSYHPVDRRTMYVSALELPRGTERVEEERLPQRAFLYDVPTGRLQPYAALDSLARRAGELLAR